MKGKFDRTFHLRQIPVRALREQLNNLMLQKVDKDELIRRMEQVLEKSVREPATTIRQLVRDDLVRVINRCPEIDNDQIKDLFEEYRYGANPSFFIYLFDPKEMGRREISAMRRGYTECIEDFNRNVAADKPKLRYLVSEGLFPVMGYPEVIEGNYRYQRRVDLIGEDENPNSIYETIYGFFWINKKEGYVVIQAHDRLILHRIATAIKEGARLRMVALYITKELKQSLPFLVPNAICSSKLHDPDPDPKSKNYRWLSVTDDHLAAKRYYETLEKEYPAVSTVRYKINLEGTMPLPPAGEKPKKEKAGRANGNEGEDEKQAAAYSPIRTLSIDLEDGEMSIAGKLTATQFRVWALQTLADLLKTIKTFHKQPEKYLQARKFDSIDELKRYQPHQRQHITKIVALIMSMRKDRGAGSRDIGLSPLSFARDMGPWVEVRFRMRCPEPGCKEDGYFLCPNCKKSQRFRLMEHEGSWYVQCAEDRVRQMWWRLPLNTKCEGLHEMDLTQEDLETRIEILPTDDLLQTLAEIGRYIREFKFAPQIEYFMIQGRNLIYYRSFARARLDKGGRIFITENNIYVKTVHKGGQVAGMVVVERPAAEKAAAPTKKPAAGKPRGAPLPVPS